MGARVRLAAYALPVVWFSRKSKQHPQQEYSMSNNNRHMVNDHMPPDLAKKIAEQANKQISPPPAKNQDGGAKTK